MSNEDDDKPATIFDIIPLSIWRRYPALLEYAHKARHNAANEAALQYYRQRCEIFQDMLAASAARRSFIDVIEVLIVFGAGLAGLLLAGWLFW